MTSGFDNPGPSNHLFYSLIYDLLNFGFKIHLISRHTTGKMSDIPEDFLSFKNFSSSIINSKIEVKTHFVSRYLIYVLHAFKSIKFLKKHKDSNLVFVQSCPTAPFQVFFSRIFVKKPVIYNVQDMFPGSSIATKVIKNFFLKWFFKKFHQISYWFSTKIIAISEDMKHKLLLEGVPVSKISVIHNWFDEKSIHEIDQNDNSFIKKYNIDKNKFIIQYAGGMGYVFDFDPIIKLAKVLQNDNSIQFHIIGDGSKLPIFKGLVANYGLRNILFFPMQPFTSVSNVYSSANVCVIPLIQGVIGNSVPSKAPIIMACKRVIINFVEDSFYSRIFNDNRIGFSFTQADIKSAVQVIYQLKNNHNLYNKISLDAFSYTQENYSRRNITQIYIKLFEKVGDLK